MHEDILVPLGTNINFTMELAIFTLFKGSFPKEVRNCKEWHKGFWLSIYYFASLCFHIGGLAASNFIVYLDVYRGVFHKMCSHSEQECQICYDEKSNFVEIMCTGLQRASVII